MKKIQILFYNLLLLILIYVSLFILLVHGWIYNNFGQITVEQILFTMFLPLKGTGSSVIKSFINDLLIPILLYSLFLIFIFNIILDIKYFNKVIIKKIYVLIKSIYFSIKHNYLSLIKFIKIFFIFIIFSFFCLLLINFVIPIKNSRFYNSNKSQINENSLIAHTCGQINDNIYTNSLEALEQSIKNKYKFIEIDLCITDDNKLVAMHDFEHFKQITKSNNIENIKQQKIYDKYTPLLANDINKIFTENKNLILVTDKIQDFDILLNNFKFIDRMIVEVFSYEKYKEAKEKGIQYPALCINSYEYLKNILKYNIKIVTTEISFFKQNIKLFKYFHKKGVVILVYGTPAINDVTFLKDNLGISCSLAYVDDILPGDTNTK